MKNNIRILFFILTLLFIGTALTINKSISESDILDLETKHLSNNLHEKEDLIDNLFKDSLVLKTFINSERYPLQVKEISKKYADKYVYLYIYKNNKPIFWSSNIYVPETEAGLKKETNFIKTENFAFVVKQKNISKDINILALIPIEQDYLGTKDQVKRNQFFNFLDIENLRLAEFGDSENIRNIYSKDRTFLFSITLKGGKQNNIYLNLQIIFWVLASLTFAILLINICYTIAKSGSPYLSVLILFLVLVIFRIFDIETNWFTQISSLEVFDSNKYSFNYFTPNLWSYFINSISILGFVLYCGYIRGLFYTPEKLKDSKLGIFIYYLILCVVYVLFKVFFEQLSTLITHSDIQRNLSYLFSAGNLSFIQIFIYSTTVITLVIITDLAIYFGRIYCSKVTYNLNIQLITLVQFLIISAINSDFTLVNVLVGVLIMIRTFDHSIFKENNISTQVITLISLALISTIKFSEANKNALIEQMKFAITELKSEDDVEAVRLFAGIEKEILRDENLKTLIQFSIPKNNPAAITNYIKQKYLKGYLSKYDFKGFYYYNNNPIGIISPNEINNYREKVITKSIKVNETNLFYKSQSVLGSFEYFSIISLPYSNDVNATLILDFSNSSISDNAAILSLNEKKSNFFNPLSPEKDSYALYRFGSLVSQKGKYTYANSDAEYPQEINTFFNYKNEDGFYHVGYKPNKDNTIIVSKSKLPLWQLFAIASMSFVLLYLVFLVIKLIINIIPKYFNEDFRLRKINYQIKSIFSKIRYSTRIQTLVISSVIIAILISGLITFYSILVQQETSRQNNRLNYISQVSTKLEKKIATDTSRNVLNHLRETMSNISQVLVTDYNLYDKNGKLFFTTQPRIYNQKLVSDYINPDAFIDLNVLKKTESTNPESIADFAYESFYAPIHNSNYNIVAYLGIPYFDSTERKAESRNILLNTIFNVYTLMIIVFAFLSIYIANKITEPLQFIRKKLSQTNLSTKHIEPLYWEKDDEVGALVKEYNYMLIKLEENAKQLRNAEREVAWREMAQQVAHEIKNPLTPMKLGIQQLDRSFKENDPKLKDRFERISNSFIEQIDALAHIASEFSAFAKLPDTKLVPINIIEKITKSIDVFRHTNSTTIELENKSKKDKIIVFGDRDQLLRTFNNLLKNATEATTSKKRHLIKITIESLEEDWIQILIADNGDGIPKEVLPNIFKPNFTTKSSGTGLGLAFVKQTIDGMNGRISFRTKINVGTTFIIEIPLYKEDS